MRTSQMKSLVRLFVILNVDVHSSDCTSNGKNKKFTCSFKLAVKNIESTRRHALPITQLRYFYRARTNNECQHRFSAEHSAWMTTDEQYNNELFMIHISHLISFSKRASQLLIDIVVQSKVFDLCKSMRYCYKMLFPLFQDVSKSLDNKWQKKLFRVYKIHMQKGCTKMTNSPLFQHEKHNSMRRCQHCDFAISPRGTSHNHILIMPPTTTCIERCISIFTRVLILYPEND